MVGAPSGDGFRHDGAMTAAGHARRRASTSSVAALATAVAGALAASGTAVGAHAQAARPTGQLDGSFAATGTLRAALLEPDSGSPKDRHPDPGSVITIRSRLRVEGAAGPTTVLLVTFRSRAGERCLGISVYQPRLSDAPECLPCQRPTCLFVVRGGGMPDAARIVAGTVDPRADEALVTDRSGRVRSYRLTRTRITIPIRATPFLLRTTGVRRIEALREGVRVDDVRFP